MIPTLTATRYITPLREGGSLPAVVQADDGQLYAMKFTGADPQAALDDLLRRLVLPPAQPVPSC
jgi:hypothetical protein